MPISAFSITSTSQIHQALTDLQTAVSSVLCDVEVLSSQINDATLSPENLSPTQNTKETFSDILSGFTDRVRRLEIGISGVESLPQELVKARSQQQALQGALGNLSDRLRGSAYVIQEPSKYRSTHETCTTPATHETFHQPKTPDPGSQQSNVTAHQDPQDLKPAQPTTPAPIPQESPEQKKKQEDEILKELRSLETLGLSQETLELLNGIPGFKAT